MKAYRTYITVTDPKQVVLTDIPFRPGDRVEVLLIAQSEHETTTVQELKALFKETQALAQIQPLSDEEIAAEVAAYRNNQ